MYFLLIVLAKFTTFAFGSYLNLLRFKFKGLDYFRAVVENIIMNSLHQQMENEEGIMTQAQVNLQSNKQNTCITAGRRVKDTIRKNTLLVFDSNSFKLKNTYYKFKVVFIY